MPLTDREKQTALIKIRKLLARIYNINSTTQLVYDSTKELESLSAALKDSGMDEETIAHHAIRQN